MKWGETIYPEGCEVGRGLLILWGRGGEGPFNPVRHEMGRDHLSRGVRGGEGPFNPVGWGLFIL